MPDQPPQVQVATYTIGVTRVPKLVARLAQLAKQAEKLGVGSIAWEVGEERLDNSDKFENGRPMPRAVQDVLIVGTTPHLKGWTFVAKLTHTEAGNLITSFGDEALPISSRSTPPTCEHCGKTRKRNTSFLLRNADGRRIQIGSGCLKEFFEHANPAAYAAYASLLDELRGEGWDAERWRPPWPEVAAPVEVAVAFAFDQVREDDKYVRRHTYESVRRRLFDWAEHGTTPTSEGILAATEALDWIRAYQGGDNHIDNLRIASNNSVATNNTLKLLCTIPVAAWNKQQTELETARKVVFGPSTGWVGTVGLRQVLRLRYERGVSFQAKGFGPFAGENWMTFHVMRDENDNSVVWKTERARLPSLRRAPDGSFVEVSIDPHEGEEVVLECTIKEHGFYEGEHQTTVTRCKAASNKQVATPKPETESSLRKHVERAEKAVAKAQEVLDKAHPRDFFDRDWYRAAYNRVSSAKMKLHTSQQNLRKYIGEHSE